ncbi:MAG: hypothetical protein IKZ34_00870 [Alphaproteobacteria bacterium]|nr:hypothetical protein [Alphaproteobacteria bacterium]
MKLCKRIFPYVLATGSLLLPSCKNNNDTVSCQGVVIHTRYAVHYIDMNNDGYYDKPVVFLDNYDSKESKSQLIRNNIKTGDTIKFHMDRNDLNKEWFAIYLNQLDSINGDSWDSLLKFYRIKELCPKFDSQKTK